MALPDLALPDELQPNLLGPTVVGNDRLMATMRRISQKFGRGTASLGASGRQVRPAWGMRQHIF
jgi:DNA polymerase V